VGFKFTTQAVRTLLSEFGLNLVGQFAVNGRLA